MRLLTALVTLVLTPISPLHAQQPAALRIVVLEGEGAVNIIQQKTAVRPLVEVRDRNNLPVAGASVTFSIGGGGQSAAFAGGAQTLTVTTNAAGQAGASGLNAISSGAFQIQVQAAYQGQIATAAISQTNFATAAAAAQAGAGAAAGGGGGGLSATTIGIIAGAAGAGAVAASQLGGGEDPVSTEETFDIYNGSFSGQFTLTSVVQGTCVFTEAATGSVTIELAAGNATGQASLQLQYTATSVTGNCTLTSTPTTMSLLRQNTPVSGGPSALTFGGTAQIGTQTHAITFNGSLNGSTINGTVGLTVTTTAGASPNVSGSATFPVTLTGGPRP
jgi:hypothetical protein